MQLLDAIVNQVSNNECYQIKKTCTFALYLNPTIPRGNLYRHELYLRGETRNTFDRNRLIIFGTPLLMAPAKARCSNGDSL